jgi:hypothetical protein
MNEIRIGVDPSNEKDTPVVIVGPVYEGRMKDVHWFAWAPGVDGS